jgi:hypothetical protein
MSSTSVATKGADALAGSNHRRWRANGSREPVTDPKVTIAVASGTTCPPARVPNMARNRKIPFEAQRMQVKLSS